MANLINHQGMDTISPVMKDNILELCELVTTQSLVKWQLGKYLIEIRDKYLNQTSYKNISELAWKEFGLRKQSTYNYIFLAQNFNEEEVNLFGMVSKLYLLKGLKRSIMNKLLKWMKETNPTYEQIRMEVAPYKGYLDSLPPLKCCDDNPRESNMVISRNTFLIKVNLRQKGIRFILDSQAKIIEFWEALSKILQDHAAMCPG